MQTPRENQSTFFDLAVQQRGSANRVLEAIAREVDFREAEARVAATTAMADALRAVSGCCCA